MSSTIVAVDLREAINDILEEYGEEVIDVMADAAEKTVKKAVKTLKSKDTGTFDTKTGNYRKGWRNQVEKGRLSIAAVAYNKTDYQLTHLLEFGHVLVTGGRTHGTVKAFPHIAQVNDQAQKDFIEYIEKGLSK